MEGRKVPRPGPAKLKRSAGPEQWLEAAKDCKYLSEHHMKQLCEIVKEYMMEGGWYSLEPGRGQVGQYAELQFLQNQISNLFQRQ